MDNKEISVRGINLLQEDWFLIRRNNPHGFIKNEVIPLKWFKLFYNDDPRELNWDGSRLHLPSHCSIEELSCYRFISNSKTIKWKIL